ncbi:MAG: hypothetical protein H7068_06660 [Pedobacter sp.]|nr:hypothetical protein [Chitinophagaceae bacterium]
MRIQSQKIRFILLLAIAITTFCSSVSAQRYYGHSRSYYPSPRLYSYAPRPIFRPSLHINLGIGGYGYARPYSPYYRPYVPYGPSIGFRVNVLPFGYYPFSYGNDYYYYNNNTFYRRYDERNYEVVAPPIGVKLPQLPRDAKPLTIDGITYYELGGTYYQETLNNNNQVLYEVVGVNGKLNTNINNQGNNYQNNNQNLNNQTPNREPIEGDIVDKLPEQCRTVTLNGQTLYVSPNNIYYQQIIDGNRISYKVVGK